ncbi:hypothetical protein [Acidovorax sp.]|uniref:hypothetical protein n=1 Tax=Acidovorax sp. TaxID=1872122 RepID=UPI0025B9FF78|nr:hypothetical protein [Acidovorax sp.]
MNFLAIDERLQRCKLRNGHKAITGRVGFFASEVADRDRNACLLARGLEHGLEGYSLQLDGDGERHWPMPNKSFGHVIPTTR